MKYTHDEVIELMDEVERQGGQQDDRICGAKRYIFTGTKHKPVTLPGCGNALIFEVPYEGERGKKGMVTACAVDDDLAKWPRFGGDAYAHSNAGSDK